MEKLRYILDVQFLSYEELTGSQRQLIKLSQDACQTSYSPYSHFAVGAALMFDNGETLSASNQENAAFPSGLCAERSLLFYAKSYRPDANIDCIAISARKDGQMTQHPVTPCGACRQVIQETAERQKLPIQMLLACEKGAYLVNDARQLLPLQFNSQTMQ